MVRLGLFLRFFAVVACLGEIYSKPEVKRSHHHSGGWSPSHCWDSGDLHKLDPFCALYEVCNDAPAIEHGTHTDPVPIIHGTQVTYTCDKGFYMIGQAEVICAQSVSMAALEWGPRPKCAPACPSPPKIEHGSFAAPEVSIQGTEVNYTCDTRYIFENETTSVICLGTSEWSVPSPVCVPNACPPIPHIENGNYTDPNTTEVGTLVEYSCFRGYYFENVSTELCLDTGEWSLPLPVCKPTDCYPIATIDNGHTIGSPNNTILGSVVTYECDEGYQLTDTNQTECLYTGYWSLLPECVKPIKECGPLPTVAYANITEADNGTEVGASAQYACVDGFELVGNDTIECLPTLEWSITPTCQKGCDFPPEIDNGYIIGSRSHGNGDSVRYNCTEGFAIATNDTVVCNNGIWSKLPLCKPKCNEGDIIFLVDDSGSVGASGFDQTRKFVNDIVNKYPISTTNFGMAAFSTDVQPVFNLNTFSNRAPLTMAIWSTRYAGGKTATSLALKYARTDMLQMHNGRRPTAQAAVVVVTDGDADDKQETVHQAQMLKEMGVTIYAVGVGNSVDPENLRSIASSPKFVFSVDKYDAITSVAGPLSEALCQT